MNLTKANLGRHARGNAAKVERSRGYTNLPALLVAKKNFWVFHIQMLDETRSQLQESSARTVFHGFPNTRNPLFEHSRPTLIQKSRAKVSLAEVFYPKVQWDGGRVGI